MSAKDKVEADNVAGLPTEFRFDESPISAVMKDGEPSFVAKDPCDVLEHSNHRMAVTNLDEDEKGGRHCLHPWRSPRARDR